MENIEIIPNPEINQDEIICQVDRDKRYFFKKLDCEKHILHIDSDIIDLNTKEYISKNRNKYINNTSLSNSVVNINKYLTYYGKIPKYLKINNSPIHGFGVFTDKDISINEYLGDYQSIIRLGEICFNDNYSIIIKSENYISYDSSNITYSNWSRFINHSTDPNVKFEVENITIRIYALRDIKKDEELTAFFGENYIKK